MLIDFFVFFESNLISFSNEIIIFLIAFIIIFLIFKKSNLNQKNNIYRISTLLRQISDQREVRKKIEDSRFKFLLSISHDLKQPIHAMNLYLGTIDEFFKKNKSNHIDSEGAYESLQRLKQCNNYLNTILESLIELARIDARLINLKIEKIDVEKFCKEIFDQHFHLASELNLKLEFITKLPQNKIFVNSDKGYLERIIRNFLSNSLRYTQKGGIRIKCVLNRNLCRISIVDTGKGISLYKRKEVFQEFSRVENISDSFSNQGLGLGLATVKQLASKLGSSIRVNSYLGLGSVFSIDIPIFEEKNIKDSNLIMKLENDLVKKIRQSNTVNKKRINVLVCIDSDPDICNAVKLLSKSIGIQAIAEASSSTALEKLILKNIGPDCVMIDTDQCQESVEKILEKFNSEFNKDLPVIISKTNFYNDENLIKNRKKIHYLNKPFSPTKFKNILNIINSKK